MPVWWHIKITLPSVISFIKNKAVILVFICLMPTFPYCFPPQRAIGSYLLAVWILNFVIRELTIMEQHRFLSTLAIRWNEHCACTELFPREGDRGCLGCDTVGTTQGHSGRGVSGEDRGSQPASAEPQPAGLPRGSTEEFRRWEERPMIQLSRCRGDENGQGKSPF